MFTYFIYGLFLIISIASTTPIMIIMTIIATPMYMRSDVVANPVTAVAVGACVAAGMLAVEVC